MTQQQTRYSRVPDRPEVVERDAPSHRDLDNIVTTPESPMTAKTRPREQDTVVLVELHQRHQSATSCYVVWACSDAEARATV